MRLKFQSIGYFGTGSGDPLPDPAPSGIRIIPVSGFPDSGKSGGTGCCRIVENPAEPDSDSGTPLVLITYVKETCIVYILVIEVGDKYHLQPR